MIILASLFFAISLYILAFKRGMPTKRWFALGGILGPLAFLMFNVHYRRALVRCIGEQCILWRP